MHPWSRPPSNWAASAGRRASGPALHRASARPLASACASIVYYIRRAGLIKIGTTVSPAKRFSALLPDEILAVEPGGYPEERARHRQFRHLQGTGEHFAPAPELLEHIRIIRETYGDPDPAWPTTATYGTAQRHANRTRPAVALPAPESGIMLTSAQAEQHLGINDNTLRGWVRRRKIFAAGRDEAGRLLYCAEHLIFLHDQAAGRVA